MDGGLDRAPAPFAAAKHLKRLWGKHRRNIEIIFRIHFKRAERIALSSYFILYTYFFNVALTAPGPAINSVKYLITVSAKPTS